MRKYESRIKKLEWHYVPRHRIVFAPPEGTTEYAEFLGTPESDGIHVVVFHHEDAGL